MGFNSEIILETAIVIICFFELGNVGQQKGVFFVEFVKAEIKDTELIYEMVCDTIRTVYPKFYPVQVVDFFCRHHSKENIIRDIKEGCSKILYDKGRAVGTGTVINNHITRVFVRPGLQRQGYGSYIMQCLEDEISVSYDCAYLDASLPACIFYEKLGYKSVRHESYVLEKGAVLVYDIMEKQLAKATAEPCYDGRIFVPLTNSENGEVDERTKFEYHQRGNIIWAEYSGGDIIKGHLLGRVEADGELSFYYHHLNKSHEARTGKCKSKPKLLENGKLELHEQWQWLDGDASEGSSVIVEI